MDFFTEAPATDAVWTCSVVRVLVVPKRAYDMLLQVSVRALGCGIRRKKACAVWLCRYR